MAFKLKLMAVAMVAGLALSAPVQAQPRHAMDAHQQTLANLRACRDTQSAAMAHLEQMARGGRMGPRDVAAHRQILARLAQCRTSLTAALAHLDDMARAEHH